MQHPQIAAVFDDIILGRGVKRFVHDLHLDGQDYSELFKKRLVLHKFLLTKLRAIPVAAGLRYPGFFIMDGKAYFGHLFVEVFSDKRQRKIWGSVIRNKKGDWKYIIPGNSSKELYINQNQAQEVDIFHLT